MDNLIIMGSPREKGHSSFIANWYLKRLKNTEMVSPCRLDISACNGCDACKENKACVISDSMNDIYQKIRDARRIIIVHPIYFLGLPSQLKALIDRTQLFWHHPLELKKKALVMMLGENSNASLKDYYQKIWRYPLKNWGVQNFHIEVMGNIRKKEDIQEDFLQKQLDWLENKE